MTQATLDPRLNFRDGLSESVLETIAQSLELTVNRVTPECSLVTELGMESLDLLDITYALERRYKVRFPRLNALERASEHFDEDNLVKDGVLLDRGLELLVKSMPEIEASQFKPKMRTHEIANLLTPQSLMRVLNRLLDEKESLPSHCEKPNCGADTQPSQVAPEVVCTGCGAVYEAKSGDEVLLDDLIALDRAG